MSVSRPEEAATAPEPVREDGGTETRAETASGLVVLGSGGPDGSPVCADGVCAL
ncbi:hypothetical protein GCM10010420_11490 [Streptomyces glaucosporus]|uniref:Uncharacterized protein n=1 Tax=Streptomyces glaucosporus TaxID=284044 RepID=A0ABN3HWA7_9ACTN